MKRNLAVWLTTLALVSLMTQAYQCASPEFTGAKVYMQQKNYKEAIRLLDIEVQKNPANEEAWYMLGALKGDENDYEGMNVAFNAALKLSSKHAAEIKGLRYNKWGTHLNNGASYLEHASSDSAMYFEKAIDELKKAISAWPDTVLTYRYLGYAYNNKGDYDNALAAFRKAWDVGRDVESLKRGSRIHITRGEQQKSKFEGENAEKLKKLKNLTEVEKGSKKNEVMKSLGAPDNVRKGAKGSRKEDWSYNEYNLQLTIDGEKVVAKTFTKPYNVKIDSTNFRLALVEYNNAIQNLEMAKNVDEKDNEVLTLLLQAYVGSNKIKEAIKAFKQTTVNEPKNKTNWYILGVLYRTDGNYDGAIQQFRKALEIDAIYGDAMFDLGATYYNWGVEILKTAQEKGEDTEEYKLKFKEALPYLEKVAELKKDSPEVWETLGTIYARLGQSDKAMKALDQADKIRKGN